MPEIKKPIPLQLWACLMDVGLNKTIGTKVNEDEQAITIVDGVRTTTCKLITEAGQVSVHSSGGLLNKHSHCYNSGS